MAVGDGHANHATIKSTAIISAITKRMVIRIIRRGAISNTVTSHGVIHNTMMALMTGRGAIKIIRASTREGQRVHLVNVSSASTLAVREAPP